MRKIYKGRSRRRKVREVRRGKLMEREGSEVEGRMDEKREGAKRQRNERPEIG